jgi:hypothetical protein
MTDRPILFSAPMVRALLDRRKTSRHSSMNRRFYVCGDVDTPGFANTQNRGAHHHPSNEIRLLTPDLLGQLALQAWSRWSRPNARPLETKLLRTASKWSALYQYEI